MTTDIADFPIWAEGRAEARFTDWLCESAGPTWEQVTRHPFTDALADGTLPRDAMVRYLVQDYSFIDALVVLLGAAVVEAPTLADRLPLGRFLGLLASEENTYFERCFAALGVSDADRAATPLDPVTAEFQALLRRAARGPYAEMMAVLSVAEWCYLAWADRVKDRRPAEFWFAEWIELHTGAYFEGWVGYLRGQLDRDGPALDPGPRAACRDAFLRTVRLEKAFFDMAYGAEVGK